MQNIYVVKHWQDHYFIVLAEIDYRINNLILNHTSIGGGGGGGGSLVCHE